MPRGNPNIIQQIKNIRFEPRTFRMYAEIDGNPEYGDLSLYPGAVPPAGLENDGPWVGDISGKFEAPRGANIHI